MCEIVINGCWVLSLPEYRAEQWKRWNYRWEVKRVAAMHAAVGRAVGRVDGPPVVFDVGAEQGDLPCLWATWGARVVLVEPSPAMWPTIRATFEANGMVDRVAGCFVGFVGACEIESKEPWPLTAGPWPFSSRRPMTPEPGFGHLNEAGGEAVTSIDRLAVELDTFPDVITVDVEGAEHSVMSGATHVLETSRPDVLVSIHPEFMADRYDTISQDLHDMMVDAGYRPRWIATDHEQHWLYTPEERT